MNVPEWNPFRDLKTTVFFDDDHNAFLGLNEPKKSYNGQSFYDFCEKQYLRRCFQTQEDVGYFSEEDEMHTKSKDWSDANFWKRRILRIYHDDAINFINLITDFGRNHNRGMNDPYIYFDRKGYQVTKFRSLLSQLFSADDTRFIAGAHHLYSSLFKKKYRHLYNLVKNKRMLRYFAYKLLRKVVVELEL